MIHLFANAGCSFVDLVERQIAAASDRNQQAPSAFHRGIVDQRIRDCRLGRGESTLVALGLAGSHHRLAHLTHDSAHVGEVEIDEAFLDHQVGNAGHPRIKNLVRQCESVGEGRFLIGDAEQILIGNDEQRVDAFLQFANAAIGGPHPALALEVEWLGYDADRENPEVARRFGNDRSGAGAGAAAHSGGDEHHVGAGQVIADLVDDLFGRSAAHIGLRAGAQTFGCLDAHLDDPFGLRHRERLRVGISDDKIDALQASGDHVVDRVAAGAADPEYGDAGFKLANIRDVQIDGHDCLFFLARACSTPGPVRSATGR